MNLFRGLIFCKKCGKKYNGKPEGKNYNYVCSTYKNYGVGACTRGLVKEQELVDLISLHFSQELITREFITDNILGIEVDGDLITIFYKDGSKSEWSIRSLLI